MKNIISKTAVAILLLLSGVNLFNSCNYLDIDDYFVDTFNEDSIFVNKINLNKYLWHIPTMFPEEGNLWAFNTTPGIHATDESTIPWGGNQGYPSIYFLLGEITPDNADNFGGVWGTMYKIIRKCNTILANIHKTKDLTTLERGEILGYTYFMRAYAYYHLVVDFGPVVLLGDEILNTNEMPEYYDRSRATYDESVDYICEQLELAAPYMPNEVLINQLGRPARGAAYAMVSRLRLIQASPTFNGGSSARSYFGNWTRTEDGVHYVSQNYDEKRWAVAAAAAKRVIDMNLYELHTVPLNLATLDSAYRLPANVPSDGIISRTAVVGDINPYKSYKDMFSGEAIAFKNKEYIWAKNSDPVGEFLRHSAPIALGGVGGMCISQKIVDAYYMEDGRTIHNPSVEFPYSEEGTTSGIKSRLGYRQQDNTYNMYNNREWRFYANVGFHNCYWPLNSTTENQYKGITTEYNYSGTHGIASYGNVPEDATVTGYVTKKYIHDEDAFKGNDAEIIQKVFPIIRYAEVLLNYVEALNNLTGAHTLTSANGEAITIQRDAAEMERYFNMIRYRVALPGLTSAELADVAVMQSVLENERMVEFFQENRRFYDIRRWGIMEDIARETVMGMNTSGDGNEYFQRTIVNLYNVRNRSTEKKLVFVPIPRSEIDKSSLLDQNPGY